MKDQRNGTYINRDISLLLLLLWAFLQAITLAFAQKDAITSYLVLFFFSDAAVLVTYMGRRTTGLTLGGTVTCVWVAWKMYSFYESGAALFLLDYVVIPIPLMGVGIALMYEHTTRKVNMENMMLRRQVEDLVLIDETSGLYNLRALYRDMQMMVHYSKRNSMPLTLMIVQMRYESELRSMLSRDQYLELRKHLTDDVTNNVRVEDRVYCIDEHGTMAVLLTTTVDGSSIVRARINKSIQEDNMGGILARGTKLGMRYAAREYDDETYKGDMVSFKKAVESELVYDV